MNLIIILAGLFYGLSFPPVNFYPLIFVSFVILIDITYKSEKLKQVIFRTYTIFLIANLVAVSWISLSGVREGADPFLILGGVFILLVYPLFFIPPMILFFIIKKNLAAKNIFFILIAFPFIWTGFEYVSSLGQISFPWLLAGNSQTYNLDKLQFAEYSGVFGVSFWICIISVLLFHLLNNLKNKNWNLLSFKTLSLILIIVLVYFLPNLYSYLNDSKIKFTNYELEGKIKIGIVQPNINPWKKWGGKQNDLINQYADMIKQINSQNPDVKMIVLPETALPYYFREKIFEERFMILKNVCDSLNLPLLIGTPDLQIYEDQSLAPNDAKIMRNTGLKYDTYNSAFFFEPGMDKNNFQKHYKIKLVIGSERMPYQEVFPFTKSLIEWGVGLGNWQMGSDTTIFILDGKYKFNTAICYESVYPEFFADFVNKGADFSVIITNDGWWGKFFGTYQHNQFAVFRAIENRRWIVRCANTGISCFIDPYGNMFEETNIDETASIVYNVGLRKEKTFYTEHGDLFSKLCLISGIIFFGVSFLFKKK